MIWWDQFGLKLGQEEAETDADEEGEREDGVERAGEERRETE